MVIVLFKVRTREGIDPDEYGARFVKLLAAAKAIPGFVSIKGFSAEDGEELALVEFRNHDALNQWRSQSDHMIAQDLGRSTYYTQYQVQVCDMVREYKFKA